MRFSEEERERAQDSLRAFLETTVASSDLRASAEEHTGAAKVWKGLCELGWTGLTVDASYGGLGLAFADLGLLYEELGQRTAPAFLAGSLIVAEAIAACGDATLAKRWLPRIVAGEARVALPANFGCGRGPTLVGDATSNVAATVLVKGERSGLLLREIASLEAGPPAVDRTRRLFDAPEGDDGDVIWLVAEQWEALFDHAALALASDSVGGSAAVFEATVDYLGVRKQFGRVIGSFQALKHRAADWKVLLEACRALTATAFAARAPDRPMAASASGAKAYVCDAYAAIAGDAVQLHGGIGFTWEHACHVYLKRAKLNQALLGGASAQRDRAAHAAFAGKDAVHV